MKLKTRLFGTTYGFRSVREVLARANEARSGDELAGLAARSERERIAAKMVLADLTLKELRENPVVPYERDEVTRTIDDGLDREGFARIRNRSVGEFREWLLDDATSGTDIASVSRALTGEMAAVVAKICSNLDLIVIASRIRVVTKARTTIGLPGRLSTRLQPNHPRDDREGIAAAIYEGLAYATGDALIGINPCIDDPGNIKRLIESDRRDYRAHRRADPELRARPYHDPDESARGRRADRYPVPEPGRNREGAERFRNQRCDAR